MEATLEAVAMVMGKQHVVSHSNSDPGRTGTTQALRRADGRRDMTIRHLPRRQFTALLK